MGQSSSQAAAAKRRGDAPMAHIRRRLGSLQVKLSLLLGLVVVATVLVLGGIGSTITAKLALETVSRSNLQFAHLVGDIATGQINATFRALRVLSASPEFVADLLAGNAESMTRRLQAVMPANPDLESIGIVDASGFNFANSLGVSRTQGLFIGDLPQFHAVLELGEPQFISLAGLGSTTGQSRVTLAVPIRDPSGQVIGVTAGAYSLVRLAEQIAAVKIGERGRAAL